MTPSAKGPAVEAVLRLAVRILPAERREWGEAMKNEAEHAGRGPAALAWALGCLWTAAAQRLAVSPWLYLMALSIGVCLVALCEWRTDEDTITLGVIVLSSLALGAMRPRTFWLAAVLIGAAVFAIDLFAQLTGRHPIYVHTAKLFAADPSTLALIVPALIAGALGAGLAKLARSGRKRA